MAAAEPAGAERPPDVAAFLRRFTHFGAAASVESYVVLFHRQATLFDDGMERPLTAAEIPAHIAEVLAVAPGFAMTPERWRARGAQLFVEARNCAAPGGVPVAWHAVYRIDLDGDLVRRGRRYFDRMALLAPLMPDATPFAFALAPAGDAGARLVEQPARDAAAFVAACAAAWAAGRPEAVAALYRADGALETAATPALDRAGIAAYYRRVAPLALVPRAWAGDAQLLFIEWEGRAGFACVERVDLVDGLASAGRVYCDRGALQHALEA